jgi:hypothetical protein
LRQRQKQSQYAEPFGGGRNGETIEGLYRGHDRKVKEGGEGEVLRQKQKKTEGGQQECLGDWLKKEKERKVRQKGCGRVLGETRKNYPLGVEKTGQVGLGGII